MSRLDIGSEGCTEEAISYCVPGAGVAVMFHYNVV